MLLIHGLGSTGIQWIHQVEALEARFRLLVPDLPGSGRSRPPVEEYSIAGLGAWLWSFIDGLGIPRINIAGFSMGGAIALEMALQHPDRVSRLILINSLASYRLDHWRKWRERLVPALLIPLIGRRNTAALTARRLFPHPWQGALRARAVDVITSVPTDTYFALGRALTRWAAVDRLSRVRSKTLVIAAEEDFTPLDEKRLLACELRARLVVIRGSRHGTPFDSVRATNALLCAFLLDQPLPPPEQCVCDSFHDPLPPASPIPCLTGTMRSTALSGVQEEAT
ncbi:MAG TPA: alpha/beta hydrolase [Steroidobacteraceae bacterium]|nr:alpha/beta hydrolase [Steroidobacteraceae bacterium]